MARMALTMVIAGTSLLFAEAVEKTNIAITELAAEGIEESSVRVISDRLRTELFKTGAFTVVERGQMEEILKEQGFQQSGCASDACVVEVGQILGVKQMVAGSVGRLGGLFTLNIRMIDVATANITHTVNVDCRCPIEDVLTTSTTDIARQLAAVVTGEEPPPIMSSTAEETDRGRRAVKRDGEGGKVHRKWPKWLFGSLAVVSTGLGVVMDQSVKDNVDKMQDKQDEYYRYMDENPPDDPYPDYNSEYEKLHDDAQSQATSYSYRDDRAHLGLHYACCVCSGTEPCEDSPVCNGHRFQSGLY